MPSWKSFLSPSAPARAPDQDKQVMDPDEKAGLEDSPITYLRSRIIVMGLLVSLGGMIFGYDTGQISGFLEIDDFKKRFAQYDGTGNPNSADSYTFSASREGTIVGLLSIGTLIGCVIAGPVADILGRKRAIVIWNIVFIIGVVVQMATIDKWYQLAIGRLIAGWGVGGLSVMTPMYQSETVPKNIRGAMVCMYQLFITLGIFLSNCINYGTSTINGPASWRITIGIGLIFPVIFAGGIVFLRESPRWDYRHGKTDASLRTIALSYGKSTNHVEVQREYQEIKEKFEAEDAGGSYHPWYEIFTGPRMAYRTVLGITLQILQQLTGANFFFYYGTSIFASVGISNSFVTAMILSGVNFGCTFGGLYVVENFGRRKALITGGCFMFAFFMVFASVGHFVLNPIPQDQYQTNPTAKTAGTVMIVFACLFIVSYATTWGPIVWALVPELYPSRYRAKSMGFATAGNWTFNFLIAFFTTYIVRDIDYRYGYIFAACNFAGVLIVYFFVCETQGRTLEEIDTCYVMHVKPWKSSKWQPPVGEQLGETDHAYLTPGARGIAKGEREGGQERRESVNAPGEGKAIM